MTYFYIPASGQVISEVDLYKNTGFSPSADPSVLAANGIYTVIPETDPYDYQLYNSTAVYTVVGDYAQQSWTAVGRDLPTAKIAGGQEVKVAANNEVNVVACDCGFTTDLLVGVAGQDPLDRPARFQAELDEMVAISNQLDGDLTAIDNATTVDEINNIVNKPTGTLFTGRGAGLGPLDLNISYYTAFNSVSMTEAETELYIPGTSTVINYGEFVPNKFDSAGICFTLGDYLVQIREVATGMVIAEFECPLAPAGENVAF